MANKKSRTFSLRSIYNRILRAFTVISDDCVTVYAAQATLFIIISAIPFIMLLFSLSRYVVPDRFYDIMITFGENLPGGTKDLYLSIINEMSARPALPLVSITAVLSFYSASRGFAAVRDGVATVYRTPKYKNFFYSILVSFAYTAIFIVIIIALVALLLFGDQLYNVLCDKIHILQSFEGIFRYRNGVFFVILVLVFSLLYWTAGRRSHLPGKKFRSHIPGAAVAAAGWLLFSFFYSLYTLYFSDVSYIYGSLTAIVLLMLWLYFCMIILLGGAEFNKTLSQFWRRRQREAEIKLELQRKESLKKASEEVTESTEDANEA